MKLPSLADFWAQFIPNVLATLIGVLVGVPVVLAVERHRDAKKRRAEEAELLRAAEEAVASNVKLCAQLAAICTEVQRGDYNSPTFPMEVEMLDALLPRLAQVSPDLPLIRELNNFRYQLHHLDRKLDHWVWMRRLPVSGRPVLIEQAAASALATVRVLEQSGSQTLSPLFTARRGVLQAG